MRKAVLYVRVIWSYISPMNAYRFLKRSKYEVWDSIQPLPMPPDEPPMREFTWKNVKEVTVQAWAEYLKTFKNEEQQKQKEKMHAAIEDFKRKATEKGQPAQAYIGEWMAVYRIGIQEFVRGFKEGKDKPDVEPLQQLLKLAQFNNSGKSGPAPANASAGAGAAVGGVSGAAPPSVTVAGVAAVTRSEVERAGDTNLSQLAPVATFPSPLAAIPQAAAAEKETTEPATSTPPAPSKTTTTTTLTVSTVEIVQDASNSPSSTAAPQTPPARKGS